MSEAISPRKSQQKIEYVFQLPATTILELCAVLDPGDCWAEAASVMPGIGTIDIDACRRLRSGERPTEALLRIWGSKGYRVLDLYKVFFRVKLFRCMQILLDYIAPEFHHFARGQTLFPDAHSQQRPPNLLLARSQHPKEGGKGPFDISGAHVSPSGNESSSLLAGEAFVGPNGKQPLPKSYSSAHIYSKKGTSLATGESSPVAESQHGGGGAGGSVSLGDLQQAAGQSLSYLQNTLAVSYEELRAATNQFASEFILGKGGYGVVYKGLWKQTEVAIKRIQGKNNTCDKQLRERLRQTTQELQTLGKYRHDNILSLYGYSMDGPEPCLIYQFMANGSVDDRLHCRGGSTPLTWPQKLEIARGTSRGLHFLHSAVGNLPIIHGDVKSANILLDRHMEPKLGDFGLCRMGRLESDLESGEDSSESRKPLIASHIKGTLAYLPPEFTSQKIFTTKLDVYSYGVVLLELATGQRAYSTTRDPSSIVDFVLMAERGKPPGKGRQNNAKKGEIQISGEKEENELVKGETNEKQKLVDKRTPNSDAPENVALFRALLALGLRCTEKNRFQRPTFADVLTKLNELQAPI